MKILVIKPSSLGDVIHGLRVVNQIRSHLPEAVIDWVIKEELAEILIASGFINKILLYKRRVGWFSFLKLAKVIRETHYDYVIDLQGLLRSGFLTFLARGTTKLGVADGREFSTIFYKCLGEKSRKKEIHAIDKLTPFLDHLGFDNFDPVLPLKFPMSILKNKTKRLLQNKPYILLFPESRRPEKIWPYFKRLFRDLKKDSDFEVVVAGQNTSEGFKGAIDLRGKLNLAELPCLISNSKLVVTNDSAPLHIASALNVAIIALFGPTSQFKYGPYPKVLENSKVIQAEGKKLESISPEIVLSAAKEFLVNKSEDN